MSILFPKVNKPREWDYRPIYYDKDKEARKEKLARLHNHSMRDEYERRKQEMEAKNKSRLTFWIALLLIAFLIYYFVL